MNKVTRIALVGYTNTQPFEWALEKVAVKNTIKVTKVTPSECARLIVNSEVELSLLPLGALDSIKHPDILTDYGIACDGKVRSVCVFSNCPIEDIDLIYLDDHSRTSQKLALILLNQISLHIPKWKIVDVSKVKVLKKNEAMLMIGDKVFDNENRFKFSYDLGLLWKEKTGLPFVFAVWVHSKENPVDAALIAEINGAFAEEIKNLDSTIQEKLGKKEIDLKTALYFKRNIDYYLSKDKKMAMTLFLEKMRKLEPLI